jgi:type IV secretion system protein VirB10
MRPNLKQPFVQNKDPRAGLSVVSDLSATSRTVLPEVAARSSFKDSLGLAAGIIGAALLGAITLLMMNNQRVKSEQTQNAQNGSDLALRPQISQSGTVMDFPSQPLMNEPPPQIVELPPQPQPPSTPPVIIPQDQARSNVLVYDSSRAVGNDADALQADQKRSNALSGAGTVDELTGFDPNRQVRSTQISNPTTTVPQGTFIPAVLETALNSDLPGYTRAMVSRDVRGFDGSRVLIPRGTRLIGTYRSGLTSGQKRLFITWTRLIRPDGASMALSDPSTDNLGQAGQTGEVNNHFFKRFGSAMLLSIIGGLASSQGDGDSSTIIIGTASGVNNAATAALQADSTVSPTIKVAQGTPIQVFSSRDLDFAK